ncbi:hypothetical protein GCM10027200_44900 [Lentzea nigeriaca]
MRLPPPSTKSESASTALAKLGSIASPDARREARYVVNASSTCWGKATSMGWWDTCPWSAVSGATRMPGPAYHMLGSSLTQRK